MLKRILSMIIIVAIIISCVSIQTQNISAMSYGKQVPLNPLGFFRFGNFVIPENSIITQNSFTTDVTFFTSNLISPKVNYSLHLTKNKKYTISFTLKSSLVDKYFYVCIPSSNNYYFRENEILWGKYINCKKGKKKSVKITFKPKESRDYLLSFCYGLDEQKDKKIILKNKDDMASGKLKTTLTATNISVIENGSLTVYEGQKVKLKIKGYKKLKWKSSKKKVATVSKKGVLKAKRKGTTTITAKKGKKKWVIKVKVKKANITLE